MYLREHKVTDFVVGMMRARHHSVHPFASAVKDANQNLWFFLKLEPRLLRTLYSRALQCGTVELKAAALQPYSNQWSALNQAVVPRLLPTCVGSLV